MALPATGVAENIWVSLVTRETMTTKKQVELLQLAARLAVDICSRPTIEAGSADVCNLHELALAGLGYDDPHPQVPLAEIERYVKEKLGNKLPVKE